MDKISIRCNYLKQLFVNVETVNSCVFQRLGVFNRIVLNIDSVIEYLPGYFRTDYCNIMPQFIISISNLAEMNTCCITDFPNLYDQSLIFSCSFPPKNLEPARKAFFLHSLQVCDYAREIRTHHCILLLYFLQIVFSLLFPEKTSHADQ